jgi:hypothetical protein
MTSPRTISASWCALLVGALLIAACSEEQHSTPQPTAAVTTASPSTTAVPSTSTTSAATTTTTSTTSTTSTTTTTTIPAVKGLALSDAGLGDALFGAEADGVVTYVNSVLGAPTSDSGWVDPGSTGLKCTGTQARFVTWRDLALFFTDQSNFGSKLQHFASYTYGPAFGPTIDPYGLATVDKIGVGSTLDQLRFTYPSVRIVGASATNPTPHFYIGKYLSGSLSSTKSSGLVTVVVGGTPCSK